MSVSRAVRAIGTQAGNWLRRLSFLVRGGLRLRCLLRRDERIFGLIQVIVFRLFLRRMLLRGFRRSVAHVGFPLVELPHLRNVGFPDGVGRYPGGGPG